MKSQKQHNLRKRGRPAGKNRVSLTLDERRLRNKQYEKERRLETATLMNELAEAAGCTAGLSHAEILATATNYLQGAALRPHSDDIPVLRRRNQDLMNEIAALEERLSICTNEEEEEEGLPLTLEEQPYENINARHPTRPNPLGTSHENVITTDSLTRVMEERGLLEELESSPSSAEVGESLFSRSTSATCWDEEYILEHY